MLYELIFTLLRCLPNNDINENTRIPLVTYVYGQRSLVYLLKRKCVHYIATRGCCVNIVRHLSTRCGCCGRTSAMLDGRRGRRIAGNSSTDQIRVSSGG